MPTPASSGTWAGRRVLVTGAGGFIGSHLVERLVEEGATTRALVRYVSSGSWGLLDDSPLRDQVEVVAADVRDAELVRQAVAGVDVVFHLAALIAIPYSYRSPRSYVETNVLGTLNVLEAARAHGVEQVVHTSTSEVYGSARTVPIDEAHPLQTQSPYAASKLAADKLAESFWHSYELPLTTVRPFNTYGPRQSARAVIPTIITQALEAPQIKLGSLTPTRDFNYVDDTVRGFLCAATHPEARGQVVNLGRGEETSIADLAATVLRLVGREIPVVGDAERVRPERSEVDRLCASNARAQELLGWQPSLSLEEGLQRTIDWIRANLSRYRVGVYTT